MKSGGERNGVVKSSGVGTREKSPNSSVAGGVWFCLAVWFLPGLSVVSGGCFQCFVCMFHVFPVSLHFCVIPGSGGGG